MKGIVFTEFMDLVEEKFGYDLLETIIQESQLANDGAYTAVGTYPHAEMVRLVLNLSKHTNIPPAILLKTYGEHFIQVLIKNYGHFFRNVGSAFELLSSIENYIHVEVLKLYPDAELPTFACRLVQPHQLEMIYTSERQMSDFAEGLIVGCLAHFGEKATVDTERLDDVGKSVKFTITRLTA